MQFPEADLFQWNTVDQDLALCWSIEPQKKPQQCGFSGTGLTGNTDLVPFVYDIIKMFQDLSFCTWISESHIFKFNGLDLAAGNRMFLPGYRCLLMQDIRRIQGSVSLQGR